MSLYVLRPIRVEDEALILHARNSEGVRHFMLSQDIIAPEVHAKWMAAKLIDCNAPYYLFLHQGVPIGVVGVTQYQMELKSGEWGFYIFAPDAPKGTGTTMLAAFLDIVFAKGFLQMTSLVFDYNLKSLQLHEKLGFERKSVLTECAHGKDATVWRITRAMWQAKRVAFCALIETVRVE